VALNEFSLEGFGITLFSLETALVVADKYAMKFGSLNFNLMYFSHGSGLDIINNIGLCLLGRESRLK
jgi:hypothetical protein